MSAEAFARSKGCSTQRLRYWAKRLMKTDAVSFVSVRLPAMAAKSSPTALAPDRNEIVCEGVMVRVREDHGDFEFAIGFGNPAQAIGAQAVGHHELVGVLHGLVDVGGAEHRAADRQAPVEQRLGRGVVGHCVSSCLVHP